MSRGEGSESILVSRCSISLNAKSRGFTYAGVLQFRFTGIHPTCIIPAVNLALFGKNFTQ